MTIYLNELLTISDPSSYKMHTASEADGVHPLDVFVRDRKEWEGWNRYRGRSDRFSRQFIFSLIKFRPEPNIWLFGGIYEVIERLPTEYRIRLVDSGKEYIGRLKVRLKRPARIDSVYFEDHYEKIVVSEILKSVYDGEEFAGLENIHVSFTNLESIIKNNKRDWRVGLENVKGVYLIADRKNGKKYVGSAYGDSGIWSRWSQYVDNGYGHHSEALWQLLQQHGMEYARENFQFTLLEHWSMRTDDDFIIHRESFWKRALLSGGEFGYNLN